MNPRPRFQISPTAFGLALAGVLVLLLGVFYRDLLHSIRTPSLIISEIMAANRITLEDEDGEYPGWIEIHNPSLETRNLAGWSLTDNFRNPTKWTFPSVPIPPGGFTVVFASGKNRTNAAGELHTNFRLDPKGEYLALVRPDGRTVEHEYLPKYPAMDGDVSFGLRSGEFAGGSPGQHGSELRHHAWFIRSTPGQTNAEEMLGKVADTRFSVRRGFFNEPFQLTITTTTPDAEIRYTTDGSLPSLSHGTRFSGPIPIGGTTVLRAAAFKPGYRPTDVDTQTYLFPADVEHQAGAGFPSTWGDRDGKAVPADYAMDPEIAARLTGQDPLKRSLLALPSLSLVMDPLDLFGQEAGIYCHPMESGRAWERRTSVELLNPDGSRGFQVNCGIRIQGGWSRRPEESPKHSFRLIFDADQGTTGIERALFGPTGSHRIDSIILRAGCNNSWLHWNASERRRGELLRDPFMRESFRAVGGLGARGGFFHLYLNGLYWGIYNACERPDASFLAGVLGGKPSDYESRNAGNILSGDALVWDQLFALANAGLDDPERYRQMSQRLDLEDFCAFMLVQIYGGTSDWDAVSNWYAGRRIRPPGRYRFLLWDAERSLENTDANILSVDDDQSPTRLFQALRKNPEFRERFARFAHAQLEGSGALAPDKTRARYSRLAEFLRPAIVAESARWGDYRRDVHPYKEGPYELYTVEDHWEPEVKRLLDDYFPKRSGEVIRQLREEGLY